MNRAFLIMTPFAMHLADIRRRLGISQTQMAEQLGFAGAYLCAVENGTKPISDSLLDRLDARYVVTARDRARLRDSAKVSALTRRMPQAAAAKAFYYVDDLWSCMNQLEEDDWVALHSVLDVIRGNRHRKVEDDVSRVG